MPPPTLHPHLRSLTDELGRFLLALVAGVPRARYLRLTLWARLLPVTIW